MRQALISSSHSLKVRRLTGSEGSFVASAPDVCRLLEAARPMAGSAVCTCSRLVRRTTRAAVLSGFTPQTIRSGLQTSLSFMGNALPDVPVLRGEHGVQFAGGQGSATASCARRDSLVSGTMVAYGPAISRGARRSAKRNLPRLNSDQMQVHLVQFKLRCIGCGSTNPRQYDDHFDQ